jgi:hypothetical protein
MNGQRTGGSSLVLPIQSAPVYRSTVGGAAVASGVDASGWIEDIGDVFNTVKNVVNTASQVAGPIASALSAFGV